VLIDVREIHEVKKDSIPLDNVLYHPMSVIMDRLPFIAKDQQIILGCTKGVRSSKVANLLNLEGYPEVANLDGGFQTWKAKGLPSETHLSFIPAGGCGCNSTAPDKASGSCC
jgi:rhodanese-related sulfurtransferase